MAGGGAQGILVPGAAPAASDAPDLKTLIKSNYHSVPQLVAFIDILGFRDLIARLDSNPDLTGEAYEAATVLTDLNQVITRNSAPTGNNISCSLFSDTLVVSQACFSLVSDLSEFFSLIASIQAFLLLNGQLSRGAVVVNKLIHTSGFMLFGKALINAYDLEQKVAKYPRVVISDEARGELQQSLSHFKGTGAKNWDVILEKQDFDGLYFVNYLRSMPDINMNFEKVRDIIVNKRANVAGDIGRKAKLYWLAKYFNDTCSTNGVSPRVAPIEL